MGTDFFDDDLAREREAALRIKLDGKDGNAPRDGVIPSSRDLLTRSPADLSLTPLARHKQEVTDQMVDKAQELDRLRARQEELERERRTLEELRGKQEAFDSGRREMKERLNESLVRMEKEQARTERLSQLLDENRRLFRERMEDLSALNEQDWADEDVLDELNKALALLESVRSDYTKAMAKLEAVHPATAPLAAAPGGMDAETPFSGATDALAGASATRLPMFWLRAGLAFTAPLMGLLLLLWLLFMCAYFWM